MNDSELGLHRSDEMVEKSTNSRLSESEDSDSSLLGHERNYPRSLRSSYAQSIPSLRAHILISVANAVVLLLSTTFMFITLYVDRPTLQDHWRATSWYSPIYDRFQIPKISRVTNGTLFDTKPPSIWRARTGSNADAAWDRVGSNAPPIVITAKEVEALGKDPKKVVRFPDDYGYGPDAYLASVESFHHIHCLDKLRKEISYKHYWQDSEGPSPGSAMHEAHTSHCIDVLIQSLMCTGSVDMITYNWVEGRDMMMPDFNNNKVCRDFEAVLGWVNDNGVHFNETQIRAMKPPPDAVRVPNELHPPT